uniref:Uncharacterized protein n=1 Tax=Aegilops tauschii subsp. strangulata TaxID=200361 RepID=A0A453H1W8_AEGTS
KTINCGFFLSVPFLRFHIKVWFSYLNLIILI